MYNPQNHPLVKDNNKKVDQILLEFYETVEGYYQIKDFRDGNITREEFIELYSFISSVITSDEMFKDVI